jgi:hypothetical protein
VKEEQVSQARLLEQLTSRSRSLLSYMRPVRLSIHHYSQRRHHWRGNHPASIIITLVEDKATWHRDLKEWQAKLKGLSFYKTSSFQIKVEFLDKQDKHPPITESSIWASVQVDLRLMAADSHGMKMEGLIYLMDSSSVVQMEEVKDDISNVYSMTIRWLLCVSYSYECSFHSGEFIKQKGQLQARMWPVRTTEAAISLRSDVWKRNISHPSHITNHADEKG